MKRTHQLLRLKCSTVEALKDLRVATGAQGIDDVIVEMIGVTSRYRRLLEETGWMSNPATGAPGRGA